MSSVRYYRDLVAQRDRVESFRRAIERVVRPGDTVLEIGAGLGTFAFFAADAGANHVWAIDGDPIIHVAETIGRLNGYFDRVQFVRGWLPGVQIDGRADVIIFEDLSPRLVDSRLLRLLRAIEREYAAAEARYIPAAAEIFVAPLTGGGHYGDPLGAGDVAYGLDWSVTRDYVTNAVTVGQATENDLGEKPFSLGTFTFSAPCADALGGCAEWQVSKPMEVTALAYWFDLLLGGEERLSNAPGAEPASWGHCVLPIDPPLAVSRRGVLRADVRREERRGEPGWFVWEVEFEGERRSGHEFRAFPASVSDLVKTSPDARPRLNDWGRMVGTMLDLVNGERSIREVTAQAEALLGPDLSERELETLVASVLSDKITIDPS